MNNFFYSSSSLSTFRRVKVCVELNNQVSLEITVNKVNSHWTYTSLPTDVNTLIIIAFIVPKQLSDDVRGLH